MTPKITELTRRRLEQTEAQWNATGQLDEGQISFLFRLATAYFSARDEAYEMKLAAAGGEDVPGSANCVTAADVTRWREEGVTRERAQDARFARLRIAFHDAIRRPLGVTPDSGAEFYDPRMADEAEERRAAQASPKAASTAWPAGCIKPGSCSRHRGCMYARSVEQCRHFDQDLTQAVEAAVRDREWAAAQPKERAQP